MSLTPGTRLGPYEIVAPPTPGHKVRVSSTGAGRVWWMPGGDEACYRSASLGEMMIAKITRKGDDLEVGEQRVLFQFPRGVIGSDLSHDGQRVLASYTSGAQDRALHVILNWTALVKR